MDEKKTTQILSGLSAAYIDGSLAVDPAFKPSFISNNPMMLGSNRPMLVP